MTAPYPTEAIQQFGTLVRRGTELLCQLQQLLNNELEALQNRELEALQSNNQEKQTCLLALDRNIRERNGLLGQLQVGHDQNSVRNFLASLQAPEGEQIADDWNQLESALEEVKTLNQRNEQVLLRSKQSADQLLSLLQGHLQGNTLYNQKGDKGRYEGQRSLGKA